MSDSLPPDQFAELCELIFALHDRSITPEDSVRLEAWICRDEEACRLYVQYMNLHARLYWDKKQEPDSGPASLHDTSQASQTPILGFLGDVFQAGTDFLSRSLVLTLLLTIGLPGILLLVLLVHIGSQPAPELAARPKVSPPVAAVPASVAQVTHAHECLWDKADTAVSVGTRLPVGRQLRLSEGLVEVTFADGAKVLLKGPATFDTESGGQGFLHAGSLVANVPKGSEGFTIQTPTATVVDLGTEFGVSVEPEKGTAEVRVFQGRVELTAGKEGSEQTPVRRRVEAGQAVRVASAGRNGKLVIQEIAPPVDRFVRHLPTPLVEPPVAEKPAKRKPPVVANFSGGNGKSQVDQFPGRVGGGWAGGWRVVEASGIDVTASVEGTNPLRQGGDYLRVLAVRESTTGWVGSFLSRAIVTPPSSIDRGKPRPYFVMGLEPYVVSFDLRVDDLGQFDDPNDGITISGDRKPTKWTGPTTSWAIRVSGSDEPEEGIPPRHWKLLNGDRKGDYRLVDSGIKMEKERVYSFRVAVDPRSKTWVPSIRVDGGEFKKFEPMGIRSPGPPREYGYWPFLNVQWQMKGESRGAERERIGFSIDSIRIGPAEEPKSGSNTTSRRNN